MFSGLIVPVSRVRKPNWQADMTAGSISRMRRRPPQRGVLASDPVADGRGERAGGMLLGFTAGVLAPGGCRQAQSGQELPGPGGARDVSQPEPKAVASR